MQTRIYSTGTTDRVYQALKARAMAYEFRQGQRIYLEPLAEELGVSTTPVREAMNRLAERNLVIKAPRKGYIALTLTEENLKGYYELSRLLLCLGMEVLPGRVHQTLPHNEPIADLLNKLNRRVLTDTGVLAKYTAEAFTRLAALTGRAPIVSAIERCNDHLYFVRTLECNYIDHVQSDLIRICELLLSVQCEQLVCEIQTYYDKRILLLPTLLSAFRLSRSCHKPQE